MSETTANSTSSGRSNHGLIARLSAQREKFKSAAARLKSQRDDHAKRVEELTAENDRLKTRADSSASAKRVEELTAELRGLKHQSVFNRVAKAKGAREEALGDLWQLSGYKPESDAADESVIGQLLDEQKSSRAYLFAAESKTSGNEPVLKPGVGGGQGGSDSTPRKFTLEQLSDPAFVMRNQAAIVAEAKDRVDRGLV